jgi:hypothetical protein
VSLVGVSNEVSTSALKSKEDTDDEQEENDALDDSVEILCFSFNPLFKLDSCNKITMLHKPSFMFILALFSTRRDSYKRMNRRNERIKYLSKIQGQNKVLTVAICCRCCMLSESLSKLPSSKCKLPMESKNIKIKIKSQQSYPHGLDANSNTRFTSSISKVSICWVLR